MSSVYYLYLKTHNITGLRYLGQTKQNPFKYSGSGKYWSNHLRKHGNDVSTEILGHYETKKDLKIAGLHYSKMLNIVKSNEFANLKEESGDGGPGPYNLEFNRLNSKLGGIALQKKIKEGWHNPGQWTSSNFYKLSPEEQKKAAAKRLGQKRKPYNYNHAVSSKSVTINNIRYPSISAASKATGISYHKCKKFLTSHVNS